MNEPIGMWKRQEAKRPNSLQTLEAKRPMSQENKQTPQKHRNKCQECKDHSSRRPRRKKKVEKTLSEICVWYMHIGLGCYLQAVPFCLTWLEPNITACADLRWNSPFPPARSTNLPWSPPNRDSVSVPILQLHIIRETHSALLSGPSAHQILQVLDRRLRGLKCRRPQIGSNLFFGGGSESSAKTHVPAPIHINSL